MWGHGDIMGTWGCEDVRRPGTLGSALTVNEALAITSPCSAVSPGNPISPG